jgi:hypothetical protein
MSFGFKMNTSNVWPEIRIKKVNVHREKLMRQLCVVPIDQNSVNMHKKPGYLLLPRNVEIRHRVHKQI